MANGKMFDIKGFQSLALWLLYGPPDYEKFLNVDDRWVRDVMPTENPEKNRFRDG